MFSCLSSNLADEFHTCHAQQSTAVDTAKPIRTSKAGYTLWKNKSTWENMNEVGTWTTSERKLHSVWLTEDESRILCCAPPTPSIQLTAQVLELQNTPYLSASSFTEGVQVSLFYDERIDDWEMCTKSCVGGNNRFTRIPLFETTPLTFRDMFLDSLGAARHTVSWKSLPGFDTLARDLCYHFIMQHPCNEIVHSIHYPHLFLTAIYRCGDHFSVDIVQDPVLFDTVAKELGIGQIESVPLIVNPDQIMMMPQEYSADKMLESIVRNNQHDLTLGMYFFDTRTGDRYCVMNQHYLFLHALKGNDCNMEYHFYRLRKANQVDTYLSYFPRHKVYFNAFENEYQAILKILHDVFLTKFIFHENAIFDKVWFEIAKRMARHRKKKEHVTYAWINEYLMEHETVSTILWLFYRNRKPIVPPV
jgi:hypothetical protein